MDIFIIIYSYFTYLYLEIICQPLITKKSYKEWQRQNAVHNVHYQKLSINQLREKFSDIN